MSFIRAEVLAGLIRGREVILGGLVAAAGVWLAWLGGYFLGPLGLAVLAFGCGWAVLAWRRLRFAQSGDAPGLVEVNEGQIAYFGPRLGGAVGVPDLAEIRILTLRGRRVWRLKQGDGQTILVPVEAAGADQLFDAFAALPGMDTAALVAALAPQGAAVGTGVALDSIDRLIWQRRGAGVVVR
jgi:hypothetical protein